MQAFCVGYEKNAQYRSHTLAQCPVPLRGIFVGGAYDRLPFLQMTEEVWHDMGCLVISDALEFTYDFEAKVKAAVDAYSGYILNFFSLKPSVTETALLPGRRYMMNYCTYFPPQSLKAIGEWAPYCSANWADSLVIFYMTTFKQQFVQHVPSLVQTVGPSRRAINYEPE